jgi:hypothetical protein
VSAPTCTPLWPEVRQTATRGRWLLCEPLEVEDGFRRFAVPAGFTFDFASVPRITRFWIQTTDLGTVGPCAHDWLYSHGGRVPGVDGAPLHYSREDADRLFRDLMKASSVPWWRWWPAWRAVRRFGSLFWNPPKDRRAA